jgi:glycosyltransferase involved in cell wall biosynthesis
LARAITEAGHTVFIYTDERSLSDESRVKLMGDAHGWGWGSFRAINSWVERQHLDVVNLHYQTAMYQMSPFIHFLPDRVKAVPVVTTFHDLRFPYLFPKAGKLRTWIVHRLARASAGVISTNHEDAVALTQICPDTPLKLIPIGSSIRTDLPYGFDAKAWRTECGAGEHDFVIAHFGFMNHSKGVEILLSTLAELRREGLPVKLWMIGGRTGTSDPTNAAFAVGIDSLIDALNLTEVVHWSGFVDDPTASAYLTATDVVALPFLDGASYRRSSLMAVIAHGCATVTTMPVVSIPPFKNGENLCLVPPNDVEALTNALRGLAANSSEQARLRTGARELRRLFDWSHIAQTNTDCFAQIVEKVRR